MRDWIAWNSKILCLQIEAKMFESTINTLNSMFCEAESLNSRNYCESCFACLTAYLSYLCFDTHYEKVRFSKQSNLWVICNKCRFQNKYRGTHVPQNHQISQYLCNKLHKKNDPKTLNSLFTTLPGQILICCVISQLFYTGKKIHFLEILLYCIIYCIATCKHMHWKFFIVWYAFHSTGFKKDWEVHSGAEPNCVCAPWSYVGGSSGTGLTNSEWQLVDTLVFLCF